MRGRPAAPIAPTVAFLLLGTTLTPVAAASQSPQRRGAAIPVVRIAHDPTSRSARVAVARGEALRVTITGRGGETVVLVPGLFGGAYGFRKLVTRLTDAGFRSVIVEPLGVGGSTRPPDADYSLETQGERVAAVLDSIGVESALVVAHSIGASLAFRLALARPALVRGIVSIEGGIAERAGSPDMRRALSVASLLTRIGLGGTVEGKLRDRLEAVSADAGWLTDTVIAAYLAPYHDEGVAIDAYRAIAEAEPKRPLAPRIGTVRVPIELLRGAGDHEGGVPDDQLAVMRARLAGLCITPVAGAGAMIHEERPGAVIDAVRRAARRARPDGAGLRCDGARSVEP